VDHRSATFRKRKSSFEVNGEATSNCYSPTWGCAALVDANLVTLKERLKSVRCFAVVIRLLLGGMLVHIDKHRFALGQSPQNGTSGFTATPRADYLDICAEREESIWRTALKRMPKNHVTRNDVDDDSIIELLASSGLECKLVRYFSTRATPFRLPGSALGMENTLIVQCQAARRGGTA